MKEVLSDKLNLLNTKARFIELVITEQIKIFRRSRIQIETDMKTHNIQYITECLNIKTYQYTQEEIESLNKQVTEASSELDKITQTTVVDMWKYDIDLV